MRDVFFADEIPAHLREFFEPTGGGKGVGGQNTHPT
jgi:hypothetical protein